MAQQFILPNRLDSSAAPSLVQSLLALRNQPLTIDAARVEVVGALAVEVLLAAHRQWKDDGHILCLSQPSPQFRAALETLGLHEALPLPEEPAHQ